MQSGDSLQLCPGNPEKASCGWYAELAHLAEPSPQRTPVLYQAGSSTRGREFAETHAECVFIANATGCGRCGPSISPFATPIPLRRLRSSRENGSFLLVRAASGFAVVERRNGRIYPIAPGEREGVPMTAEGVAALLAEQGCLPERRSAAAL
jgi:hypothetical protein